jgi:hypothetical protein
MNLVRTVLLGLATTAGFGCFAARPSSSDMFLTLAARNLTQQPINRCDQRNFVKYVRQRADEAWAAICRESGNAYSIHYAEGFREGFIDYVEAGGSGEPPYLPPLRYRLTKARSPEGIAAVEDWYSGFRHGASIARGSGLRELNYIPLPGPPIPNDVRAPEPLTPTVPAQLMQQPQPDGLPPPRPVELPTPQMPPPIPPGLGSVGGKPTANPLDPALSRESRETGQAPRSGSRAPTVPSPVSAASAVSVVREQLGDGSKSVIPAAVAAAHPATQSATQPATQDVQRASSTEFGTWQAMPQSRVPGGSPSQ